MKKFVLSILLAFASCATAPATQSQKTTTDEKPAKTEDVQIKKPDGNKVGISFEEFMQVKALADRYVALQRHISTGLKKDTKIEEIADHTYKITIVLDDRNTIILTFKTE